MVRDELQRVAQSLTDDGYALTSYEAIGLEFNVALAKELSATAIEGVFSPDAAKLTERIDKKEMTKIAIIEDDQAISQMYRFKFEAEGYTVETAGNGKLGLELAETMKPDIILLDLMMPSYSTTCY